MSVSLERKTRFELATPPWQGDALPLSYFRNERELYQMAAVPSRMFLLRHGFSSTYSIHSSYRYCSLLQRQEVPRIEGKNIFRPYFLVTAFSLLWWESEGQFCLSVPAVLRYTYQGAHYQPPRDSMTHGLYPSCDPPHGITGAVARGIELINDGIDINTSTGRMEIIRDKPIIEIVAAAGGSFAQVGFRRAPVSGSKKAMQCKLPQPVISFRFLPMTWSSMATRFLRGQGLPPCNGGLFL